MNVSLSNDRFFCMDTTNINSAEQYCSKQLLKIPVPLGNWVGGGNHKVDPCFKHLLNDLPDVLYSNATLLEFFHLLLNFLKNATDA